MKRIQSQTYRGALLAGFALLSLGLTQSAFAAREAADEVGRWVGFGHQAGELAPGSHVILDLAAVVGANGLSLTGVINGLPAVQTPLQVTGSVTPLGRLTLNLSGGGLVGFCDGSVRNLPFLEKLGGQDDIGDLNYRLMDATGAVVMRGHVNLIHLFGGINWGDVVGPNVLGDGVGSVLLPGATEVGPGGGCIDAELGSSLSGEFNLGTQMYDMVGTINGPGTTVMMCDGSVRNANGQISALIGLLFTGGVRNLSPVGVPAVQHFVGRFGTAGFMNLLPAVQRRLPGTASFLIGLL